MKYIAYYVKGMEEIGWKEIVELDPKAFLVEKADKRLIFESDLSIVSLNTLRIVDDIGLYLGSVNNFNSIEPLSDLFNSVDFPIMLSFLNEYRKLVELFSITISESRNNVFKNSEALILLRELLASKSGYKYSETDHTNLDFRIFIDGNKCQVSVRLTEKPLFHRSYRLISQPGALKPTIAAAMVRLAGIQRGTKMIDLFCGSGTILCEAASIGANVFGGDVEQVSVDSSLQNLKSILPIEKSKIRKEDARHTSWQKSSFDIVVSNLPWNKQIKVQSMTELYIAVLYELRRIIKKEGTICLLVSKHELLVKWAKEIFPKYKIEIKKIGFLGQNPTIVLIKHNDN